MRPQLQRQLVPWPQSRVSVPPSCACHPGYQLPHQTQGGGAGQAWGKVSSGGQASQVQEPLALTPGARNLGTWWKLYTPVKTSAREDRSGHRAPETPSLLPSWPKSIVSPGVRVCSEQSGDTLRTMEVRGSRKWPELSSFLKVVVSLWSQGWSPTEHGLTPLPSSPTLPQYLRAPQTPMCPT